jgi:hypothetical protein
MIDTCDVAGIAVKDASEQCSDQFSSDTNLLQFRQRNYRHSPTSVASGYASETQGA